jgi:hypothetical protein
VTHHDELFYGLRLLLEAHHLRRHGTLPPPSPHRRRHQHNVMADAVHS